ncbi:Acetyltransferase [Falsiruegeria litorea R37]|uniref:Acetyltransferase n=1 Tax=Falsiruegeria litorea R37 TaxID=1200284 RepID=A0A1Y5TAU6_9RHOB|nr:GNAT family N-acetyltransferase [Falsiruegeria litorea]SLN59892.1 Acetyltransferase [Falsiruegeria litorea R37]
MIEEASSSALPTLLGDLADTLHACVHDGASVGFVLPFSEQDAQEFWQTRIFPMVSTGAATLFVARHNGRVVGTVQLVPASMPNQPHRADVSKLLVHPSFRRIGLARGLMTALRDKACELGLSLLVLDTRSGDPSQALYHSLGFQVAGEIPKFCRNPHDDRLEPTTYMYKHLQ